MIQHEHYESKPLSGGVSLPANSNDHFETKSFSDSAPLHSHPDGHLDLSQVGSQSGHSPYLILDDSQTSCQDYTAFKVGLPCDSIQSSNGELLNTYN